MDTKAAFEKWWVDSDRDELRMSCSMGWAYFIWHASRAAIEIELPEIGKYYAGKAGYSRIYDIHGFERDSKDAITSHGIRIKGKTD